MGDGISSFGVYSSISETRLSQDRAANKSRYWTPTVIRSSCSSLHSDEWVYYPSRARQDDWQRPRKARYIVNDVESAVSFYTRDLGFKLNASVPHSFAMLSRGGLRLIVSPPKEADGVTKSG